MTRDRYPGRAMFSQMRAVENEIDRAKAETLEEVGEWIDAAKEEVTEKAAGTATEAAHEAVNEHEAKHHQTAPDPYDHIPGPRTDRIKAVPFPRKRIPDKVIARMIERLENGEGPLEIVAQDFGYPASLAAREIARYQSLHGKYVRALAVS